MATKAVGLVDSATVHEKIRKWQTAGGGIFSPTEGSQTGDSAEEDNAKRDAASSAKSHSRSKSAGARIVEPPATPEKTSELSQESATDPSKLNNGKVRGNRLDREVLEATAPKQRITSDGHWVRQRAAAKKEKEKSPPRPTRPPAPQLAWVREPLLPRARLEALPLPNAPAGVKVYTPRPRNKSFHSGSEDTRPLGLQKDDDIFRIASPATSKVKTPKTSDLSDARKKSATSEDDVAPKPVRPARPRRASAARREDTKVESSEKKKRSEEVAKEKRSSIEDLQKARPRQRRRSMEDIQTSSKPSIWRKSSIQKSPELNSDNEFPRPRREARRPGPTRPTHERHHSDAEEHYIHSGRRKASYQEEVAKYAPEKKYDGDRKQNARRKSPPLDVVEVTYDDEPERVGASTEPRIFGSRVEAWLHQTPDPVDAPSTKSTPTAKTSRRVFSFEIGANPVGSDIYSALSAGPPAERPQQSRKGSSGLRADAQVLVSKQGTPSRARELDIDDDCSSATSVPSLKRSGARRSTQTPPKDRNRPASVATSIVESEAESAVSSSVDASAFLPPDAPARHSAMGLPNRRLFQNSGKRLSTIVSVETLNTRAQRAPPLSISKSDLTETPADKQLELPPAAAALSEVSTVKSKTSLKRKLTTHADLISVLSMPRSKSKSIVSARSIRTHRSRLATATLADLMEEVAADETKYMRELRTLADGVILVLLKCVLSKSDAALAAGLYSRAATPDDISNATKLIRELGVALTRLKTLHKRIPKEDSEAFLNWAQSAHRIYTDYVKTWRLGFEDVVVNLATDEDSASTVSSARASSVDAWNGGLPRNEDGYIIDGNGERVDVAFLLKRPLVRLKYLTKTVKGINILKPSAKSGLLATQFEGLMGDVRKRVNDEKARIEDETAAAIDASRARDPRSLGPLSGVKIEPSRCVRARDYFDMRLTHSTGQVIDCRVELLLRDDKPGTGNGGDVLVCEVDNTNRWLFFPPILLNRLSARLGDEPGEIIVMIRGLHSGAKEWQELLSLHNDEEEIGQEWLQLLGIHPVPPALSRVPSFSKSALSGQYSSQASSLLSVSDRTGSTVSTVSRTPSPGQVQVPIGEQAGSRAKRWGTETPDRPTSRSKSGETSPLTPPSDGESAVSAIPKSADAHQWPWAKGGDKRPTPVSRTVSSSSAKTPRDLNEAMEMAGALGSPTVKRTKASRYRTGRSDEASPEKGHERASSPLIPTSSRNSSKASPTKGFSVWLPKAGDGSDSDSDSDEGSDVIGKTSTGYPSQSHRPGHKRASSVPTEELASIPKLRHGSSPTTPTATSKSAQSPTKLDPPSSAPSKLQKQRTTDPAKASDPDAPPPPPPHRTPSSPAKINSNVQFAASAQVKRRSSSPLKHEYQPSTASETSEISDISDSDDDYSLTSDSDDDDLEDDDLLSSIAPSIPPHKTKVPPPPETLSSARTGSLKPSDSASQGPYRKVPEQPENTTRAFATLMYWTDAGNWEALHPEECSVVIGPGVISAFEMNAPHSKGHNKPIRPLIALELTPLVPIRRGTALDISIRSPPTPESRLKVGNNIMLRSRSPEDCEALYTLINTARINNPTYIALQNARPAQGDGSWATGTNQSKTGRNWWGLGGPSRSRSYRAKTKAGSRSGATDSSIGTISSVMSAMKRFSGSGKFFNKRDGDSMGSGGSGSMRGGDGAASPPMFVDPAKAGAVPIGLGLSNAKVRLYVRQTKGKWQDLGSSRLSVLQRREADTASEAGVETPLALQTGTEKRILVSSKSGEVLLDATLGESCFERVARTGIAVSVWEDVRHNGAVGVAATGGVGAKTIRYYMIQVSRILDVYLHTMLTIYQTAQE